MNIQINFFISVYGCNSLEYETLFFNYVNLLKLMIFLDMQSIERHVNKITPFFFIFFLPFDL